MTMLGAVKFFSTDKGYGFILPDDRSGDVFFHKAWLTNAGLHAVFAVPLPGVTKTACTEQTLSYFISCCRSG